MGQIGHNHHNKQQGNAIHTEEPQTLGMTGLVVSNVIQKDRETPNPCEFSQMVIFLPTGGGSAGKPNNTTPVHLGREQVFPGGGRRRGDRRQGQGPEPWVSR